MNKIKAQGVRGMPDVFGDEAKIFEYILEKAKLCSEKYNFMQFQTPIVEHSEIFERTIGESSDILNKEIYSFFDRSENKLALRPEFTASVIRGVASNKLHTQIPLKLFSFGPVFRYDRPQKCRQRQFNQINYEFIKVKNLDPLYDSQMIFIANEILKMIGINEFSSYKIHINSIGNQKTRENFCFALISYLNSHKDLLSEDSLLRLQKNPLRILDTKIEKEKEIIKNGPKIFDFYDDESKNFFDKLCKYLNALNIEFHIDENLVRGLDYYDNTVFEIITNELGAQGTILAGGRYSNLTEYFGIGQIPCFGFAAGIERIMGLIMNEENKNQKRLDLIEKILKPNEKKKVCIMCIGDENISHSFEIMNILNIFENIIIEIFSENKLQKMLEKANKNNFDYTIFVGENEVLENKFLIRDLKTGVQNSICKNKIIDFFKELCEF